MEITQEQERQIEEIKCETKCPNAFKCQESDFANYPAVRPVGELLECLEQNPQECEYSIPFGYGYFCRCPLNNYICKEVKKSTS